MLAMLVSVWLAPGAHAQVGGLGDTVGTVADGGGLIGGVVDGLQEGNSSGADSDNTTDDGGGGSLIDDVVTSIEKTVENSKETVTEVTETTEDTLGNVRSGSVEGVVGTLEGTVGKVDKERDGKNSTRQRNTGTGDTRSTSTDAVQVLGSSLAEALRKDAKSFQTSPTSASTSASPPVEQSLVQQIGRIAAEAVKQAAFPIALILLVVGFLMIQNRMDSRDPKLALAPVDSHHDSLSFT